MQHCCDVRSLARSTRNKRITMNECLVYSFIVFVAERNAIMQKQLEQKHSAQNWLNVLNAPAQCNFALREAKLRSQA